VTSKKNWIRLLKHSDGDWPYFSHPDQPDHELILQGAFHVRWPNDETSIEEIQEKTVRLLQTKRSGPTPKDSITFQFFERKHDKIVVIYELHEVELLDEEVARCLVDPSRAAYAG